MHQGDGETNEDWFCFGVPIYAPADGVVISAGSGDGPDNTATSHFKPDMNAVLANVLMLGGNYVVLDHGNGEFSFLAHMKQAA
jgi:murein DD-endopeptidase MepM/ murein hydrolase activator NlpD